MSKGKYVKMKHRGKSSAYRLSDKISQTLKIVDKDRLGTELVSSESQVEDLPAPLAIDDTVLVLWDDVRDGVCHYIPKRELRIADRSKVLTYNTRVSYRARNRNWGGRVPCSISELIECCCMKSARVDIRGLGGRQVLVLWDNPSAGTCHYMYTRDLRIIDGSVRIHRGTRVAFRTRKDITWTGQVPPAIYEDCEKGSFNLMAKGNLRHEVKRMQRVVNSWFPSGQPEEFIPLRTVYAVIDGFWSEVNQFCRDLSSDDLAYFESLMQSYHNRNRIRSKVFMKHQRQTISARLQENQSELECSKLIDPLDVIGMESTVSDSTSARSSFCGGGGSLNGLRICINNGNESSPPSCHSQASSILDSVSVTRDNNNISEKVDPEFLDDIDEMSNEEEPTVPSQDFIVNGDVKSEEYPLSPEEILARLNCGGGDLMKVADAMMEKYSGQFSSIPSDIEDFITSDESFDTDVSNSSEDEVFTLMRKKQSELLCVEAKNKFILQKVLTLMKQSLERQKIEKRLNIVELRITELTGSLVKYNRLKQRTKARLRCQYIRDKDDARFALLQRRRIIKELSNFDSKCSEHVVNLCERQV